MRGYNDNWELISRCRICGAEFKNLDDIRDHMKTHDRNMVTVWKVGLDMCAGDERTRVPIITVRPETHYSLTAKSLVDMGPVLSRGGFCPLPIIAYTDDKGKIRDVWKAVKKKFREACGSLLKNADGQFLSIMDMSGLAARVGKATGGPFLSIMDTSDLATWVEKATGGEVDWHIENDGDARFWTKLAKSGRLVLPQDMRDGPDIIHVRPNDVMQEWCFDFGDGYSADLQAVTDKERVSFRMVWFREKTKPGAPCYDEETGRTDGRKEVGCVENRDRMDGTWLSGDGKHDINVILDPEEEL